MKVLLFSHRSNQNIPLRTALAEVFGKYLSHKHTIISIQVKKSTNKHFFWKRIEFYILPLFKFIKKTFSLLKSHKFDAIFIRNDLLLYLFGYLMKKIYGIPLIYQFTIPYKFLIRDIYKWYHPKNFAGIIIHTLLIKVMKNADLILPISYWMGKYLISQGICPSNVHIFPDGANLNLFKDKEYPISSKNPKFIYSGDMGIRRKLEFLIEAFKIVVEKYKIAHLFMVGDGTEIERLKKIIEELNLEKNITFTGLVPYEKVPDYIANVHIALSPIPPTYSFKLSSPLKLFEYMSCSRPVIANKEIPAHTKAIKESKGGLLVNYKIEAFAEAMIKLFQNPKESKDMGVRGRIWVENKRSYKKLALDLEKKILKILN